LKKEELVFLGIYFKIQNIPKEVVVILKIKQLNTFGRTGGIDVSKISREMMAGHLWQNF